MTEFKAVKQEGPLQLHEPLVARHALSSLYKPAPGLREALDIAMMLGVPLLLTGDPGVGKTRAAYWLAAQLKTRLLRYDVKSSTSGSDLLYHFDEVARFRDSSRQQQRPLVKYLRFNALGRAILAAIGGGAPLFTSAGELLVEDELACHQDLLAEAFGGVEGGGTVGAQRRTGAPSFAPLSLLLPDDPGFAAAPPEHLVVLIDELDKAPRDTPNDLLVEIEEMEFDIPELGLKVKGVPKLVNEQPELNTPSQRQRAAFYKSLGLQPSVRPIVIVTSNSEKSLPDPFLRRCAFFDIPFPDDDATLKAIVDDTLPALRGGGVLVDEVLAVFRQLRRPQAVAKAPGTAELLAWLDILVHMFDFDASSSLRDAVTDRPTDLARSLASAIKLGTDHKKAIAILKTWAGRGPRDG